MAFNLLETICTVSRVTSIYRVNLWALLCPYLREIFTFWYNSAILVFNKTFSQALEELLHGFSPILKNWSDYRNHFQNLLWSMKKLFYEFRKLELVPVCVPICLPTNYWSSSEDGSYQAEEGSLQVTFDRFEELSLPQRIRETYCMRN